MNRFVIAHTPLPPSALLFRSMNGDEGLSSIYHYSVELVSKDGEIDLKALLGKTFSLQIKQLNAPDHWLNGDITASALNGMEGGSSRYYVYRLDVRPRLWYLTQHVDFRIFQEKTVPDIICQIFADFAISIDNRLTGNYRTWGYCVQYNESAFDFVSRLMEHEGIYYYFKHEQGSHILVLADALEAHEQLTVPIIPYRGPNASVLTDETCVDQWRIQDVITTKYLSMDDYDFRKPYATMLEVKKNAASYASMDTEVFEWPGRYVDQPHAQFYTRVRQQERQAQQEKMSGSVTSCAFSPGDIMTLIKAARQQDNRDYLIVQAQYTLWDNTYASGEDSNRGQRCDFVVIPADIYWRSPRVTSWPKTQGPQTARVVCPEGETIWTDKYGRVKVKFHWDRYAKGDDTSSCWIRVASAWAGQGYGGVQIPRLNDEVVVDFINGDPDRPLITGRVYNDANMPPWSLPANATQMGFYSRSKTGHKETANALRFEDKMGEEQVWIHAEKNMDTDIENNETLTVGVDRNKTIGANETTQVHKNRTETVDGDETITIHQNRTETVDQDETITIHQNRTETVDRDETITIGMNRTEQVGVNETITIGANRTESVGGNESVTVNGNQTIQINQAKMETVALAEMKNVGLVQNTNIGAAYMLNVGAGWMTNVGAMQMHNVAMKYAVNAGKDTSISAGTTGSYSAEDKISITCGDSMIVLEKNGTITISGKNIILIGEKVVDIDGTKVELN